MSPTLWLNSYAKRVARPLGLLISVVLIILIITEIIFVIQAFNEVGTDENFINNLLPIIIFLFVLLIVNGLIFALNAAFLYRSFSSEIKEVERRGFPIQGIEGATETMAKVKIDFASNFTVIVLNVVSFGVYLSSIATVDVQFGAPFPILSVVVGLVGVTLLLTGSGLNVVADVPKQPSFVPGGLLGYYKPQTLPLTLDNFLADSILPWLDPATRIKFDEWSKLVQMSLNPTFEPEAEVARIRMERGREKILLMTYLRQVMTEILTEEVFETELREVIDDHHFNEFVEGGGTNFTIELLAEIVRDVRKHSPQTFQIIDKLLIALIDNLGKFRRADLWVEAAHPTTHSGTHEAFHLTLFIVNKSDAFMAKKRPMVLLSQGGEMAIDPHFLKHKLLLDESRGAGVEEDELPIISPAKSGQNDVLGELSDILQVGDAVQLQFRPNRFGTHVFNLSLEEGEATRWGKVVNVEVRRDLKWYTTKVGPKVGTYLGTAFSLLGMVGGSILGLLGF